MSAITHKSQIRFRLGKKLRNFTIAFKFVLSLGLIGLIGLIGLNLIVSQ